MTRDELREAAKGVGKERLASLLEWTVRTLDRKLSGEHRITKQDEIAVRAVQLALMVLRKEGTRKKQGRSRSPGP